LAQGKQSIMTQQSVPPILSVSDLQVIYGEAVLAVRGISLEVADGSVVALLGANGAGKTTTLKAISSLVRAERGRIAAGGVRFRGEDITHVDAASLVRRGIVQVLEGRRCFAHLTVEENILAGGFVHRPSSRTLAADLERVYTWFPRLKQRRTSPAGLNSGGEQQMIAIGRALMTHPSLVLLDEPSMGLAPMLVEEIFEIVRNLNRREGVSFLIAEQNVGFALRYADEAAVLENGQIRARGRTADLAQRDDLAALYLGGETAAA
jgi:branched-chain amino acid transport system ATP-binding protein